MHFLETISRHWSSLELLCKLSEEKCTAHLRFGFPYDPVAPWFTAPGRPALRRHASRPNNLTHPRQQYGCNLSNGSWTPETAPEQFLTSTDLHQVHTTHLHPPATQESSPGTLLNFLQTALGTATKRNQKEMGRHLETSHNAPTQTRIRCPPFAQQSLCE